MTTTAIKQINETGQVVDPTSLLPADPMVSMIERVAMDPEADLDKLERMLQMKKEHDAVRAKSDADMAFAQASAEFPEIPLNGMNKHTGNPYALLKDIIAKTRPVLARHGLALSFATEVDEKNVVVTAELSHKGGYTKRNSLPLPRDTGAGRNAVQAVGSTQTYGQRYTAQAILGLSLGEDTEDDARSTGVAEPDAPKRVTDQWTSTIVDEMPEDATPRDKALAIADALCRQFARMKGEKQLMNEWDRRSHLIEGDKGFEGKHPDLYETVLDAYGLRLEAIKEAA